MNKAKKLILAIMCGLPADNKMVKAALAEPDTAEELLATTRITKADFLSTMGDDEPLFAHEQTWDRLPQIAAMLRAQGESFTAEDMVTPITGVLSPVRYAERTKKLDRLFAPEIWEGRVRDIDRAFFSVMKVERDKMNISEIRRQAAALTGELTTEDRLRSYGLEASSVRTKIRQGNITELKADLAKHGDMITKDYIFLLDSAGDNIFEFKDTFDNIDKWLPELEAQGARLTKADFLFKVGDQKTPLQHAINHSQLPKVFTARIWQGHAVEMMELFEALPQAERSKVDIQQVLGQLKEAEYGPQVVTGAAVTVESLTRILNERERESAGFFPIHALGFARVWDDMPRIRETLAAKGQSLTLADLRQPAGLAGETVMMFAARIGHIDEVIAIARASREALTLDDLTTPGPNGKSMVDLVADKGQAASLFAPEMWVGRGRDMLSLWEKAPAAKRDTIDFEALYGRVNMLTLREKFAGPRPGL